MSDAPQRLRELSDRAKAAAVAEGLGRAVGQAFAAEIESVRYCSFDRTLEFRKPAELRVTLRALESDDCACVQAVPELELEQAVAQSLSDAADEDYRVRVTDKNYGPTTAPIGAMRLTLVIGRV
jgi:hypothetical protein